MRRKKEGKESKRAEVAHRAGVSETTVSFVFSKKRYVSPKLAERVRKAAEELDYQPDMIAASMIMKSTKTIAVLTNDIASPLQMEVIKGLQAEAMAAGYFVNVCGGTDNLDKYIMNFIQRRVDGVFIASADIDSKYITRLMDKGISVILASTRNLFDARICGVDVDFVRGMDDILAHLQSYGHKKIAYLSAFAPGVSDDVRMDAFCDGMRARFGTDAPLVETGASSGKSTSEDGRELTERLLARTRDFTAVVCTNDMMAFGAIRALEEHGLRVPEDVSVVGIDDIVYARTFKPALTTLGCRAEYCGRRIFRLLYANLQDKSDVGRESVVPELVVRHSTGLARA